MAGYRNRMVHYYHEISGEEVFSICTSELGDIERMAAAFRRWIAAHPEMIDQVV